MAKKKEKIVEEKKAESGIALQGSTIAQVAELYNPEGEYRLSVKDIAEIMGISERSVRGYVWRFRNPEKYNELLQRYFSNKAAKKAVAEKIAAKKKAKVAEDKPAENVK